MRTSVKRTKIRSGQFLYTNIGLQNYRYNNLTGSKYEVAAPGKILRQNSKWNLGNMKSIKIDDIKCWLCTLEYQSLHYIWSLVWVVGIATKVRAEWPRNRGSIPAGPRDFSLLQCPERLWGPSSLIFNAYRRRFSPSVKRPEREYNHSPPSSVEVKNKWSYTYTSPYAWLACTGPTLPLGLLDYYKYDYVLNFTSIASSLR
jgi:hypothetical protein